jgi:hypothetical protein
MPSPWHSQRNLVGQLITILCASAAFLGGLRMQSRPAAIAAGLLIATSGAFGTFCQVDPSYGWLAAASILAAVSYGIGWDLLTYGAAAVAFTQGFGGALIALVICLTAVLQKREHAVAGLVGVVAYGLLWSVTVSRPPLPHSLRPWQSWHGAEALAGLGVLIAWFVVPFLADATSRHNRDRWLMTLTTVVALAVTLFLGDAPIAPQLYAAFPLGMLIIGVGLGRLMPLIAGEFPSVPLRYAAASAAVALTLLLRVYVDQGAKTALLSPPSGPATLVSVK